MSMTHSDAELIRDNIIPQRLGTNAVAYVKVRVVSHGFIPRECHLVKADTSNVQLSYRPWSCERWFLSLNCRFY